MSTLKATNLQHASATNPAIVLDASGGMSGSFPSPNRNLLYNGAMQVAQRGTSVAGITGGGYNTADRWGMQQTTLGTWTQSVENDAPTGSGFRKSLKMLVTTADAAPAAGDLIAIAQPLEGQDLQRIAKGTASAQQLSMSFWVKSNVTGTYVSWLYDADNTRSVSATYAISASATWERKTITFPADATGVFDNDNAASLNLYFQLAAGSNFTSGTLNTTWAAYTAANAAPGQVNVAAASSNYWQVTGVQLEVGTAATPFEFKPFGQELQECQRYFYMHASGTAKAICMAANVATTTAEGTIFFPTSMRAAPTIYAASGTDYYQFYRNSAVDGFNSFLVEIGTENAINVYNATQISGTAGHAGYFYTNNAAAYIGFSADL